MKRKLLAGMLAIATALTMACGIAACGHTKVAVKDELWTMERVYAKAQELGFEGTFEELVEKFKGDAGKDGKDGVGIKDIYVSADGKLIVELTEGGPIELGSVRGEDGVGIASVRINEQGRLIVTLTDDREIDCGVAVGEDGKDGSGLSALKIDGNGNLVATFFDGTERTLGKVTGDKGETGDAGRGITHVEITAEGHMVLTFSDKSVLDLGVVVGAKGDKGDAGVGVTGASVDEAGNLNLQLSDGSSLSVGNIKGDKGEQGDKGDKGDPGLTPEIGKNGNWWLGSVDTQIKAEANSIKNITIDYMGHVVITMTDGTVYEIDVTNASCDHAFTQSKVEPTCEERGYTRYTCTNCGYSYLNDYVPQRGHHYYNGACVWCQEEEPFDGPLTSTDWYSDSGKSFEIRTPEDLAGLAYLVNKGTDFSGKTVNLAGDITLAGAEWVPIGTASAPFAGTFDGRNFTISGLKISKQTEYVGLFGRVTGAIYNVNLTGADITVTTGPKTNYVGIACGNSSGDISGVSVAGFVTAGNCDNVGGIVGATTGAVTFCTNAADVVGQGYVGGIAGSLVKTGNYTLTNLENSGDVTAGGSYVGGLFGSFNNSTGSSKSYTMRLERMTNTGAISGASNVGGLFGYLYTISGGNDTTAVIGVEFANSGNVTASGDYAGGLIGYGTSDSGNSSIGASESRAAVSGKAYVGGLAGYLGSIAIQNSSNAGSSVTATGYEYIDSVPYVYLGGYVGYGFTVSGCENAVPIEYTSKGYCVGGIAGFTAGMPGSCTNKADISGPAYVGGIAGSLVKEGNYTLTNLENSGSVTASGSYAGGLFGSFNNSTGSSKSYTMRLEIMTNKGAIAGASYVGGLFGYLYTNSGGNDTTVVVGAEFANSGDVTASGLYAGGLFGYATSDSGNSSIDRSESKAAVSGKAYVGGLAGYFGNIALQNSSNAGSSVAATGYEIINGERYAYLGGYVGCGYTVSGCENAVPIEYTSNGNCVGGIAGFTAGTLAFCTNTANVTGQAFVGGIAGSLARSGNYTVNELNNSGTVTARGDYAGGLIGNFTNNTGSYTNYTMRVEIMTNAGAVTGGAFVGGLFGYLYANSGGGSDSIVVIGVEFTNSGDVTASGSYAGGLIGYASSDSGSSSISLSESKAAVRGKAYVGGLAGYLGNIALQSSSNAGSSVSAIGYENINSVPFAYLGGYVGYGFTISGCDNAVPVIYKSNGNCVGGVAGFTAGTLTNCTNTANVEGQAYVGGIAGSLAKSGNYTVSNLNNSGDVTAHGDYAGGLIGDLNVSTGSYTSYTVRLEIMMNTGDVTGVSYVGGLIGNLYANSGGGSDYATVVGVEFQSISEVTASGDYAGGLIGCASSDGKSTIQTTGSGMPTAAGTHAGLWFGEGKNFTIV